MIVPLSDIPLAEALCIGLAGPENAGMFVPSIEPVDGLGGISHGIANGEIRDQFASILPLGDKVGNAAVIYSLATKAGVMFSGKPVTLARITGLLSRIDVSDGDPFDRLAALRLRQARGKP